MRLKAPLPPLRLFTLTVALCAACGPPEEIAATRSAVDIGYSGPELKIPLPPGYRWKLNTETNGANVVGEKPDTYHQNAGFYSLDFGRHIANASGQPVTLADVDGNGLAPTYTAIDVLAAAAGTVLNTPAFPLTTTGCVSGGQMCQVNIAHGNGYITKYLHFRTNTVTVQKDQRVEQGQFLGKMGSTGDSTGAHVHFQVLHISDSLPTTFDSRQDNTGLMGMTLEGTAFTDYHHGNFYPSTNGFTYQKDSNPYTCATQPSGGTAATNWTYTCPKQTAFTVGQTVWANLAITDVKTDFCQRADLYLDTGDGMALKASGSEWCSSSVVSDGGWGSAYLWPQFTPTTKGNAEIRLFVRPKSSSGYLPAPLAVAKFTVTDSATPFVYNGNITTCSGDVTGDASTNWVYSCSPYKTNFAAGEVPKVLFYIENVTVNHRFRARVYKNGTPQWEYVMPSFNQVSSTWNRASFWLTVGNTSPGDWKVETQVELQTGALTALKTASFTVAGATTGGAHYTYDGNGLTCLTVPTGGASTNWVYTCQNPATHVGRGKSMFGLVHINNIDMEHRFQVEGWLNSVYKWTDTPPWNYVPPGQTWQHAYFWPELYNAIPGNWSFRISVETKDGQKTQIKTLNFVVD